MSKFDSDDLEMTGYFLPEDSQLRLKKLREHVEFLSHLAQPRRADEEQEWVPEIRVGEVAICLELLAEQVGHVLDEISWPAQRYEGEAEPGADAEPEAVEEEVPDDAGSRYLFGVTLEQVDTLNRLIDMVLAHGDVVTASDDTELANHTLSLLGHAIFDGARTVREIIRQVESQRLGRVRGSQTGVGEGRIVYHAGRVRLPVAGVLHSAWPLPAYRKIPGKRKGFTQRRKGASAKVSGTNGTYLSAMFARKRAFPRNISPRLTCYLGVIPAKAGI